MSKTLSLRTIRKSRVFFLIAACLFIGIHIAPAQKAKKAKSKKKDDPHYAGIFKRGYNDIVTRNNYYFNANLLYSDIRKNAIEVSKLDYNQILPLYFHNRNVDFSNYSAELEDIIKKTSIALQLHDYTRWKDDCYLLLGKAQYLQEDYERALNTFQFISTTMKEEVAQKGNTKNVKKAKKQRQKELSKQAKERQKEMEKKKKEKQKATEEKKKEIQKKSQATAKQRKKEMERRIKFKKKNIKRKKKGKEPKVYKPKYEKTSAEEEIEVRRKEAEENYEETQGEEEDEEIGYNYEQVEEDFGDDEEPEEKTDIDTLDLDEMEQLSFWEKIRHKPARPEAVTWMAKSFIELGENAKAKSLIKYAESLPKLTEKQQKDVSVLEAYFYINRDNYLQAIDPLLDAAAASKKIDRAYYLYVTGQLYNDLGLYESALASFQESLDAKGDFTLRFNTNIQIARLYSERGLATEDEAIKLLRKLIKDRSNKQYRDQVHYMLAQIYYENGDIEKAMEELKASIRVSDGNPDQKGMSYYMLGNLDFQEEMYQEAFVMYDSALIFMDPANENYEDLEFRQRVTEEVSILDRQIEMQDSLLNLALMSEADRQAYIESFEKKVEKDDKKRRRKGLFEEGTAGSTTDNFVVDKPAKEETTENTGKWYFYNPEIKSRGFNEFKTVWGDRKLKDNWRLSSGDETIETDVNFDATDVKTKTNDKDIRNLDFVEGFDKVPETREDINKLMLEISKNHYALGAIFWNELENNILSKPRLFKVIETTGAPDAANAHYLLYLIYKEEGDMANAELHRRKVLNDYPSSQAASILRGDKDEERDSDQVFYASTYDLYEKGNYEEVIKRRIQAEERYTGSPLIPHFQFLEALSYGKQNKIDDLKLVLSKIIVDHSKEEIGKKAQEYLIYITKMQKEEGKEETGTETETPEKEKEQEGMFNPDWTNNIVGMLYLTDPTIDVREIIKSLTAFNNGQFASENLRVSNAYLNKETQIILIKRFREFDTAKSYYSALKVIINDLLGKEVGRNSELFIISQDNFRKLFETKDIDAYRSFFVENL